MTDIVERLPLRSEEGPDCAEIFDATGEKVALSVHPELILAINELSTLRAALAAAEERAEKAEALQIGEKAAPNPEWEAKADAFHAATVAEAGVNPFDTLTMLKRWKADAEPANELGQISFSRAMLDSAADALSMALEISRAEYLRANAAESLVARFVQACGPFVASYLHAKEVSLHPTAVLRRAQGGSSLEDFHALASLTAEAKGE